MNITKKILLGSMGCMMLITSGFSDAARFEISPSTGDYKMYCTGQLSVRLLTEGTSANGISYKIQFNTGQVSIAHQSNAVDFTTSIVSSVIGNIYSYSSNTVGANTYNGTSNQTTFRFRSTGYALATQLFFPVPSFGANTTADGITINDYNNSSLDALTSVGTGDYTFSTGPCITDVTSPTFTSFFPTIGSFMNQLGSSKQYTGTFLVYDWLGNQTDSFGNSSFHYWFTGGDTSLLTNYLPVPGTTVDNQAGTNSGTLNVQIVVAGNTQYSGYTMNLNNSQLTITPWTGDGTRNQLTWDGKQRGYNVQFISTTGFGVEQTVSVLLTGSDNLGNTSNSLLGNFNAPVAPTFTRLAPVTLVDLSTTRTVTTFQWRALDTWAGVDTGSIQISITQTASGSLANGQLTGKIYSGSDLVFTLISGSAGVGNSGGYLIGLTGTWDFPADSTFQVTLSGADLVGTPSSNVFTFTTRKPCSYYGCSDPLDITFVQNPGNNFLGYGFTGLLITGSDYPYLSLSGNVLSCGLQSDVFTGTLFTGNIISDISQPYTVFYTGTELYITGGTVSISGNIITVIPN